MAKPVPAVGVFGIPGTGKTMLGKVAAIKADAHLITMVPKDFAGRTAEEIRKKFDVTLSLADSMSKSDGRPVIVQIDEVDSAFVGGSPAKILADTMDSRKKMGCNNSVVFLLSGNRPGDVAVELLRKGRVKAVRRVSGLSAKQKLTMVKKLCERCNTEGVDWGAVSKLISSMTPADIQDLVEKVVTPKLNNAPDVGQPLDIVLNTDDFVEAVAD